MGMRTRRPEIGPMFPQGSMVYCPGHVLGQVVGVMESGTGSEKVFSYTVAGPDGKGSAVTYQAGQLEMAPLVVAEPEGNGNGGKVGTHPYFR